MSQIWSKCISILGCVIYYTDHIDEKDNGSALKLIQSIAEASWAAAVVAVCRQGDSQTYIANLMI